MLGLRCHGYCIYVLHVNPGVYCMWSSTKSEASRKRKLSELDNDEEPAGDAAPPETPCAVPSLNSFLLQLKIYDV